MKIFSIQLLRRDSGHATVLAFADDLSSLTTFRRHSVQEVIQSFSPRLLLRVAAGSLEAETNRSLVFHVHVRGDGLGGIVVTDQEYPPDVAFALLKKLVDEYDAGTGSDWKTVVSLEWMPLVKALEDFQDPSDAATSAALQKQLDEIRLFPRKVIAQGIDRSDNMQMESISKPFRPKPAVPPVPTPTKDDDDETDSVFMAAKASYGIWSESDLLSKRIDSGALKTIKPLSSGSLSEVWLGDLDGKRVAVKRLTLAEQSKADALVFASEIRLMMQLTHPNVAAFVGVEWTKEWEAQAVAEYVELGDLRSLLDSEDGKTLTWADVKCLVAIDVVVALAFVNGVRSKEAPLEVVKASHVLVDGECKLSVFAASRLRPIVDANRENSSLRWLAPEIWRGEPATDRSTVFSFGVLLSELDTTELPYQDAENPDGSPMSAFKIGLQVTKGSLTPTFTSECPEPVRALAMECLAHNPTERPSAASIAYRLREIRKSEL